MKAIVKATGEIVEVRLCGEWTNMHGDILPYRTNDGVEYSSHDLSFKIDDERGDPDYWTRLEHQYAGMAMQALLSSDTMLEVLSRRNNGTMEEEVAREAFDYAHALVEKQKKRRNKEWQK